MFLWAVVALNVAVAGVEQRSLEVGTPISFTPGQLPAAVVCDDLSVVRVEDAGDHFRITGLRPGSTLCSFSSLRMGGLRREYRFTVR
jgi:hypothetical protein